jgi:release factor glutamine methyltransferase
VFCANLPYIPTDELHNLAIYNREPTLALDGGEDGLDQIRKLITLVPGWLAPNGLILLEIEALQGTQALSLAGEAFPQARIDLHKDLAGKDRLLSVNFSRFNI